MQFVEVLLVGLEGERKGFIVLGFTSEALYSFPKLPFFVEIVGALVLSLV